jgi:hypothetical protein
LLAKLSSERRNHDEVFQEDSLARALQPSKAKSPQQLMFHRKEESGQGGKLFYAFLGFFLNGMRYNLEGFKLTNV